MDRLRGAATALAVPLVALGLGLGVGVLVLGLTGRDALAILADAVAYGLRPSTLVAVVNKAVPYALAGLAAAVAFRAGLFNIGIDGQYRLAAFAAAVVGASIEAPWPLALVLATGAAVVVGAGWAALAGLLLVRRGVNVVISTILLNAVATGLIAWLLGVERFGIRAPDSNNVTTAEMAAATWIDGVLLPAGELDGTLPLVLLVGVAVWFGLTRTAPGFELRILGASARVARVVGIAADRLAFRALLVSGALAGLVGLPQLFGSSHHFGLDFPAGLGFTGLAVAILGRNHPAGIALAALAWAFMERSAQVLDLSGVSSEIVTILQAVIVLGAAVGAELASRAREAADRRRAAAVAVATGEGTA